MMAAGLIRHIGPAEEIHTTVLLSIDDEYGPASAGFLLEKADAAIWHHRRAEQPDRVAVHRAGAGRLPAADRQTIRLPVPLFGCRLISQDARRENSDRPVRPSTRTGSVLSCRRSDDINSFGSSGVGYTRASAAYT